MRECGSKNRKAKEFSSHKKHSSENIVKGKKGYEKVLSKKEAKKHLKRVRENVKYTNHTNYFKIPKSSGILVVLIIGILLFTLAVKFYLTKESIIGGIISTIFLLASIVGVIHFITSDTYITPSTIIYKTMLNVYMISLEEVNKIIIYKGDFIEFRGENKRLVVDFLGSMQRKRYTHESRAYVDTVRILQRICSRKNIEFSFSEEKPNIENEECKLK